MSDTSGISRERAAQWRKELQDWHRPDDFQMRFLSMEVTGTDTFVRSGMGWWRDAFVADLVAGILDLDRVRLSPDDKSDFQTEQNGLIVTWEATEADEPDRKRGDEFRKLGEELEAGRWPVQQDPVESWDARVQKIPAALERVATKKAGRSYPAGTNLVIHLNITDYRDQTDLFRACVHDATRHAGETFVKVWVLWGSTLYLIWRDHKAVFEEFRSPKRSGLNSH